MKLRLLFLLLFIVQASVFAHPGDGPHRVGNRLYFTPACPIIAQNFNDSAVVNGVKTSLDFNGATSDTTANGWYLDASKVNSSAVFYVKSHRFMAQATQGEGIWYSKVFNIAGYTGIQVDTKISSEGTLTSAEYVKVYYKLDGGPETPINSSYLQTGNFGTPLLTSAQMTGSTVQLVIHIKDTSHKVSGNNPTYYIEQYDVFKQTGPCTITGITVSANPTNSGILTCLHPSTTITASTTATGTTTYSWSGPNGYTATGSSITVSTAGTYTVTGANSAGTGSASVTVTTNNAAPDLTATGGALGCATSATISASSSVAGVTYNWTGPNNFTSAAASPTVTVAGIYTVTVTNPTTGCTASASVTVTGPTTGTAVATGGTITCRNPSVTLAGTYSGSGATYSWTGPGGFTSTVQNPTVSVAGIYTLTVTAGACTATDTANVLSNSVAPATPTTSTVPANATLTCASNFVTLSGSSATSGVTYAWTGPNNYNVASSSANAFNPGTYTLTATNTSTGCNATATVTVLQNITPPQLSPISPSAATLTCSSPSVTLTGSSSTAGVSYGWSGPNSFTATGTTAVVTTQGSYILTVTDPSNGCTNTTTANISQNFSPPAGVSAINNGPLTCATTSVTLTGSSSTTGVTYAWSGPNGFTASSATATTSTAGTYTLTVTNPVNGCTTITNTVVAQNTTVPANLSIGSSTGATLLTCASPSIVLTASSSTGSVNFSWTGPSGFTGSSASVSVSNPGTYIVTATNSTNGCASTATASVTQNITPPANLLMTSNPTTAVLTCSASSIGFTGTSSVPGATYGWTGPNGLAATGATLSVTVPGTYTLTATDPTNGCMSTSTAVVTQDTTHPAAAITSSIPANALLSCTNHSVALSGNSTTTGVTYAWAGPSGYTATGANITVNTAGNYTVTVTKTSNGCSATSSAPVVTQNTTVPGGVSASVSDKLSCSTTSVTLTGSSTTDGVTYAWTGPNGFTASTPVTTTGAGGTYTLTATDPVNGCSFSNSITVQADTTHPAGVTVTSDGSLDCTIATTDLTGSSTTSGVTYSWAGPNGFFDPERVTTVSDSGTYFLTVANPANGCRTIASITVTADFTECSLAAPKPITGYAATLSAPAGNTGGTEDLAYKIYPNPVNTTAFVELNSPQRAHVTVEVYNGVGVREQVLFDGVVEAKTPYKWMLAASRLTAGIHYCIIRRNDKVYTSKLLITAGRP